MKFLSIAILCLFVFPGCMDNPIKEKVKVPTKENEPLKGRFFKSEKIGWTIRLPDGNWNMVTKKERENRNRKTTKEIEDATGAEVDISRVEHLIGFNNSNRSSFTSSIEPFDENQFGGYDNNLAVQREILKQTYAAKNIEPTYEIGATRVGGVMLDWFTMNISIPANSKNKRNFTVRIYNCLRKNYILTMAVGYDNAEDEETLMKVVYSSKFTEDK